MSQTPTDRRPSREAVVLQETYVDLLYMAIRTENVRWTLRPGGPSILMIVLDGLVVQWRRWSEDVAERLVETGVAPDGRVNTIANYRYHNPVQEGWSEPDTVQTQVIHELRMRADWCLGRAREATNDGLESAALLARIAEALTAQTMALDNISDTQ